MDSGLSGRDLQLDWCRGSARGPRNADCGLHPRLPVAGRHRLWPGVRALDLMLVGLLGQEQGQITSRRVLPGNGLGPEMEVSFQANGVILGVQTNDVGTYV